MEIPFPPQDLRSQAAGDARQPSVWIIKVTPSFGRRDDTAAGNVEKEAGSCISGTARGQEVLADGLQAGNRLPPTKGRWLNGGQGLEIICSA